MDTRVVKTLPADSGQSQTRSPAFFTPRLSGWHKSSQQKFPNSQSTHLPAKTNTRPTQNKIPFKYGYSLTTASFFPEPACFSVDQEKKKHGGRCICFIFHPLFLAGRLWTTCLNICFCFLSDTIKRKRIKVFERFPNTFHVHLKIWKHIASSHWKLF